MNTIDYLKNELNDYRTTVNAGHNDILPQIVKGGVLSVGTVIVSIVLSIFKIVIPTMYVFSVLYFVFMGIMYIALSSNNRDAMDYILDIPIFLWIFFSIYYEIFVIGFGVRLSWGSIIIAAVAVVVTVGVSFVAGIIITIIKEEKNGIIRVIIGLIVFVIICLFLMSLSQAALKFICDNIDINSDICSKAYGENFTNFWVSIGYLQ